MGREIRNVPLDWQHPKDEYGQYIPMFDKDYEEAAQEWVKGFLEWESGKNKYRATSTSRYYWEWDGNPPDPDTYRQPFTSPPDAFQIYETVSNGTPVSPVFSTKREMVRWLIENEGVSAAAAENFVKSGYVPSLMVFQMPDGKSKVLSNFHAAEFMQTREEN